MAPVVIPALNEALNIPYVFARLPRNVAEVILVDGFSIDDTVAVAQQHDPRRGQLERQVGRVDDQVVIAESVRPGNRVQDTTAGPRPDTGSLDPTPEAPRRGTRSSFPRRWYVRWRSLAPGTERRSQPSHRAALRRVRPPTCHLCAGAPGSPGGWLLTHAAAARYGISPHRGWRLA